MKELIIKLNRELRWIIVKIYFHYCPEKCWGSLAIWATLVSMYDFYDIFERAFNRTPGCNYCGLCEGENK